MQTTFGGPPRPPPLRVQGQLRTERRSTGSDGDRRSGPLLVVSCEHGGVNSRRGARTAAHGRAAVPCTEEQGGRNVGPGK
jgi:hypothetical protein